MDIDRLRTYVDSHLKEHGRKIGFTFSIPEDGVYLDDDWWHVVVNPLNPEVRAYQFADILSEVEQQAAKDLSIRLLLVPAISNSN